jgi:biotin synthase-like enzyme
MQECKGRKTTGGCTLIDSLEICTETGIDRDTALRIYQEAKEPIKTLELFKAAYQLKSRVLGNRVDIIVPSGVILKCKLNPPCRYYSSSRSLNQDPKYTRV